MTFHLIGNLYKAKNDTNFINTLSFVVQTVRSSTWI